MIKVANNLRNLVRVKLAVDAETPEGSWSRFVNSPEMENVDGKILEEYRKKYLDSLKEDLAFAKDNDLDLTFYEDAFGEKSMDADEARRRLLAALDPADPSLPYYKSVKYKDPSRANKNTPFPTREIKMSSARRTLGIGTRLPYEGMRTDHPFNIHGAPGQHYYSYGDTPPASMDPKYFEMLNQYGHPNISGPDFAAAMNTEQALSRMKPLPGNPSEAYLPPRGPGYSPKPRTFAPSMSQLFDAARRPPRAR